MPTWEYTVIDAALSNDKSVQSMLNDYGRDGWELVTVSQFGPGKWLIFKRQKAK